MTANPHTRAPLDSPTVVLRKLPQVMVLFWILKTVAVTLGETAGDLFGITFQLGYVVPQLFPRRGL